jgi:hypothetical protein
MFVVIMSAIMTSILYFYRVSSYTIQEATAVTSAQHGIDAMVRTMREAAYASNGAYPIVSIAANDIVFYSDVDSDSAIERVHYYLSGTNLYQGILNPSGDPPAYSGTESVSVISDYVRNTLQSVKVFSYYDTSGVLITDYTKIGSVRFVSVNVGVDVDTNKTPTPIYLRSSAALRNIVGH